MVEPGWREHSVVVPDGRDGFTRELLTQEEIRIISACLLGAEEGPFFPDWEFQTLFGVERPVLRNVRLHWPSVLHALRNGDKCSVVPVVDPARHRDHSRARGGFLPLDHDVARVSCVRSQ